MNLKIPAFPESPTEVSQRAAGGPNPAEVPTHQLDQSWEVRMDRTLLLPEMHSLCDPSRGFLAQQPRQSRLGQHEEQVINRILFQEFVNCMEDNPCPQPPPKVCCVFSPHPDTVRTSLVV